MADTDSTFPAAETATPGFGANIAVAPEVAAPNTPIGADADTSKAKAGLAAAAPQKRAA